MWNSSIRIEGVARGQAGTDRSAAGDGVAVLNADDARVRAFREVASGPHRSRSDFPTGAEVRAEAVGCVAGGDALPRLGVDFETPLAGRHG